MNQLLLTLLFTLTLLTAGVARGQAIRQATTAPVVSPKVGNATTPATYAGRQLLVGSGGGFTAASTTYYLLDNGQLFGKRSQDSLFTFLGRQTAANTKQAFATAETGCKIRTTTFDNPGNRYRFVGWRKGKQTYQVTWGEPGAMPPAGYPKFYDSFMAMVPASRRLK